MARWFSTKYGFHISLVPFIWLYWPKGNFCLFVFGSTPSKALIGIDTASLSRFQPIHSLFWISFTKMTKGEGNYRSNG